MRHRWGGSRRAGRTGWRAYRRTAAVLVLLAGALAGDALLGGSPVAADQPWVPGTGTATAQAITLAPSTAGLGYDVTLATSIADFQQQEGQAQSQTLDLGTIGLALTATQCDGSAPLVPASQLPQPAVAESNAGATTQQQSLTPGGLNNGAGAGAGQESATATPQPSATSTTSLAQLAVPGGFTVSGATTSAETQIIGGQTREAVATADIKQLSLAGGLVTLEGLHWQAVQRTGQGATQAGTFSIGGLTVAGQAIPVSADQLSAALATVNSALAPTGFHLSLPQLVKEQDGSVALTPLSIGIDDSALGQQVGGPLLGQAQPLRSAIDQALLGASCTFGTPLLLGDIGTGVATGGGNLDVELGGATAGTDGTAYADPFGSFGLLPAGGGSADLAAGTAPGDVGSSLGSTGDLGGTGVTGGSGAAPASAGSAGSAGAGMRHVSCRSTSLVGGPCVGGHPLPVGLAGLAGLLGVGAADLHRSHRLRRLTSEVPR